MGPHCHGHRRLAAGMRLSDAVLPGPEVQLGKVLLSVLLLRKSQSALLAISGSVGRGRQPCSLLSGPTDAGVQFLLVQDDEAVLLRCRVLDRYSLTCGVNVAVLAHHVAVIVSLLRATAAVVLKRSRICHTNFLSYYVAASFLPYIRTSTACSPPPPPLRQRCRCRKQQLVVALAVVPGRCTARHERVMERRDRPDVSISFKAITCNFYAVT